MIGVDLLALDGASAAAMGATVDIVSAANRIMGQPSFELRIVAPKRRVTLRAGPAGRSATVH
ncbi:MAG: hypothetical protein HYZ39_13615 [Mycolicibacterium cosmeticum]|nr:hypothetical protein [Mycolicibacterium cosmeticum]